MLDLINKGQKMSNNKKLIKVSYIRQEREYISELFPEYELVEQATMQMNIDGQNIPVDVLTVQTSKGKKTFYFDIRDVVAKYDALLASNRDSIKNLSESDFAKLFLGTVLGAQSRDEIEKIPWVRKVREHIHTSHTETEEEIDDNERETFIQILSSVKTWALISFFVFWVVLLFTMLQ